jgi:hypothetical protein
MPSRLLVNRVWRVITGLARKSASAMVAVAYFGKGASKLLPLKSGSVFVVDMSKAAVQSGQTCPQEIIKLLRRGVEVHSCQNLHAKVFVFGRRAIVGSTNVSRRSAIGLIEAAIETKDPATVRDCKKFVDELRGEHVDLDYARRLAKIYRPPAFGGGAETKTPKHPPLWLVPLSREDWEPSDNAVFEKSEEQATSKLKDQARFKLDTYLWTGAGFRRPLRVGELVLQVIEDAPGKKMLSPAARVILLRRYKVKGEDRMMVFLRVPNVRRKNLRDVKAKLGETGKLLRKLRNPRLARSREAVHQLLQLWPSLSEDSESS